MNYKLRPNMNEEDSSVREMGGDGAGTNPLKEEKKYFCFSNRLFLQSRSPRVGWVGRFVFLTTVFGIRVFSV